MSWIYWFLERELIWCYILNNSANNVIFSLWVNSLWVNLGSFRGSRPDKYPNTSFYNVPSPVGEWAQFPKQSSRRYSSCGLEYSMESPHPALNWNIVFKGYDLVSGIIWSKESFIVTMSFWHRICFVLKLLFSTVCSLSCIYCKSMYCNIMTFTIYYHYFRTIKVISQKKKKWIQN